MSVQIQYANTTHVAYAEAVCSLIEQAAKQRGTGIAKRDPEYIKTKMNNGNAVIALDGDTLAGFCYIEVWENKKYVANSGLIVHSDFRGQGLAKKIKAAAFELSKEKYPNSKLFGITTSLPVMKINSDLERIAAAGRGPTPSLQPRPRACAGRGSTTPLAVATGSAANQRSTRTPAAGWQRHRSGAKDQRPLAWGGRPTPGRHRPGSALNSAALATSPARAS